MVLLNLKRVLLLTAFSQSVLTKKIKFKELCGNVPPEAVDDVITISEELKVSSCDAKNVYNYILNGEKYFKDILNLGVDLKNFSEERCNKKCIHASKTLNRELKIHDHRRIKERIRTVMGIDFLKSCKETCRLTSLDAQVLNKDGVAKRVLKTTEVKPESELEKVIKKKRNQPCDPVSQGIINKSPLTPYLYGFYRYTQGAGSAQTAISYVNGCGPKNNAQVSKIVGSLPYAEDFRPVCNSHDICVTCHQLPRSGCDSQFKSNLKALCSQMYQINSRDNFFAKAKKTIQEADCNLTASLFADAVSLFGENAYQDTPVNTSPDCAACGVPLVKDTLYKTPFYVLK